jgi:hypothetical protein
MDILREQLDEAFNEVVSRVVRLEVRLGALVQREAATGDAVDAARLATTALSGSLEGVRDLSLRFTEALRVLDGLNDRFAGPDLPTAGGDAAGESGGDLADRLEDLDRVLAERIARSAELVTGHLAGVERGLHERVASVAGDLDGRLREVDDGIDGGLGALAERVDARLSTVDDRLAHLIEVAERPGAPAALELAEPDLDRLTEALLKAMDARFADGWAQLDQGLLGVRRVLRTLQERPAHIDVRMVEEATQRANLANAADLAQLRQEMSTAIDAIRQQDSNIGELRATLEWVKSRLLG